jgi:hypothetical protein
MLSITLTKWQQQVLQMVVQVNLNSLDSIAIFFASIHKPNIQMKEI